MVPADPVVADGVPAVKLRDADSSIVMHDSDGRTRTQPLTHPLTEAQPKDTAILPLNAVLPFPLPIQPPPPSALAFASPKVTPNDHAAPTNARKPPKSQQPGSTQAG